LIKNAIQKGLDNLIEISNDF